MQAFKLFFFALFTDKVITRKRTTKLQAVTCCRLYVCVRVCLCQYSWRTCLVRTQVASSWAGGGAKFLASCLVKLRGVALDSLWRFGSRGLFLHLLDLDYHPFIMHVDMHDTCVEDGRTDIPKHHCTYRFCIARVCVFWTCPSKSWALWSGVTPQAMVSVSLPAPYKIMVQGTSVLSEL
jgi:hypothetical protein